MGDLVKFSPARAKFDRAGGVPLRSTKASDKQDDKTKIKLGTFKKELRELRRLIKSDNKKGLSDSTVISLQKGMLKTIMNLVPLAEEKYRNSRGSYDAMAINTLINQIRVIVADIRSSQDLEEQIQNIMDRIVRPQVQLIAQNLIQEAFEQRNMLMTKIGKADKHDYIKKSIRKLLKSHSLYLDASMQAIDGKLREYLLDRKQ